MLGVEHKLGTPEITNSYDHEKAEITEEEIV